MTNGLTYMESKHTGNLHSNKGVEFNVISRRTSVPEMPVVYTEDEEVELAFSLGHQPALK